MLKIVVIPTYNEKENLAAIVAAVLDVDSQIEVLIVDDASPDGSGRLADQLATENKRLHVLHRRAKQGIGPAYRDGFRHALEMGADYIVQMDADFSHPPTAIAGFFEDMQSYDLVLGSRYVDGVTVVNWPMGRLLLSYCGNLYARLVLGGLPVKDATGGFKCWRREVLEAIELNNVRANGYGFQIEMTYRAWRMGFRIKEVSIVFVDRQLGSSKMHLNIAAEALLMVWKLRWRGLTGAIGRRRLPPPLR